MYYENPIMLLQIVLRIFHTKSVPIQPEGAMARKDVFKTTSPLFPKLYPTNILYYNIFKSFHISNGSISKYIRKKISRRLRF